MFPGILFIALEGYIALSPTFAEDIKVPTESKLHIEIFLSFEINFIVFLLIFILYPYYNINLSKVQYIFKIISTIF